MNRPIVTPPMTKEEIIREIRYCGTFHTKEAIQQAIQTLVRKIDKYGVAP